ncbi:hypothetical protein PEDI_57010 [Persicobacter diffluens]|uniref:Uncharacterized protein n=1 Tax=Persicobacter diffluens TaxID=981 RepID=A0AAN4W546_9BACT|nr:hypothetical protein PEDI_52920 [Persicobacter diffluens]GJM65149.1 hypothetical protein PEDI_57010 [Persicobacter diffluens]
MNKENASLHKADLLNQNKPEIKQFSKINLSGKGLIR